MLDAKKALAIAEKYTDDALAGAGALKGVPCQIQSITAITGGNRVTFLWVDNNGDSHTSTMDVMDGEKGDTGDTGATGNGIKSMEINSSKHVIVTYDNDDTEDIGEVPQIQADWEEDDTTADAYIKNKPTLGTASSKDSTDTVRPNNHDLVESNAVYNAINNALTSVYTPRGDLTCAELTSALLIEENVGSVYEMSDSGVTTDLFLQGAGITISANDNVGIIKAGQNTYLFNYMGNAFDLHDYQKKALTTPISIGGVSQTTVEGALGALNTKEDADADNMFDLMNLYGAKNLLFIAEGEKSNNGVQFTPKSDGSIHLQGSIITAGNAIYAFTQYASYPTDLPSGDYILTGRPKNVSGAYLRVSVRNNSEDAGTSYDDSTGNGVTVPYVKGQQMQFAIIAFGNAGTSINMDFYPMFRMKGFDDDTFEKYAMTNQELTEKMNTLVQYPTIRYTGTTWAGMFSKIRETFGSSTPYDGYAQLICDTSDLSFIQGLIYRRGDRIAGTLFPPNNGATKEQYFIFTRTTAGQDYIGKQTLALTELSDN